MPEKDPSSYQMATYLWVFALAMLGGVASFFSKVQQGLTRWFNVTELIGELMTSAFAGIVTFYLCEYANFQSLLTAALVGISGHMGSRAIFVMEKFFEKRILGTSPIDLSEVGKNDHER